jgi:hypothetical protein
MFALTPLSTEALRSRNTPIFRLRGMSGRQAREDARCTFPSRPQECLYRVYKGSDAVYRESPQHDKNARSQPFLKDLAQDSVLLMAGNPADTDRAWQYSGLPDQRNANSNRCSQTAHSAEQDC